MKTRIEHLNSENVEARLRKPRQKKGQDTTSEPKGAAPVDQYGCVRWQPTDMPDDETEESLGAKWKELIDISESTGLKGLTKSKLDKLMNTTYDRNNTADK